MNRRGRPQSPDILTPREWEVLGLLREGLTNREIAEALEISLAGAKFHVSEIITKLGVESREEAAAWRGTSRPGYAFIPAILRTRTHAFWATTGGRFVVAASGLLMLVVLLGLLMAMSHSEVNSTNVEVAAPTTTPDPHCPDFAPHCVVPLQFATAAEAAAHASFLFRAPDYIPDGFSLHGTMYQPALQPIPNAPPSDESVILFYEDASGHILNISEGHPAFNARSLFRDIAPRDDYGFVPVNGKDARWVNGVLDAPVDVTNGLLIPRYPPHWVEGLVTLSWSLDGLGGVYDFSPKELSYSIGSNILPLEELVRIAESVPN